MLVRYSTVLPALILAISGSPAPDSSAVNFNFGEPDSTFFNPGSSTAQNPEIAPCPGGADFCEDVPDYPTLRTQARVFTNPSVLNSSRKVEIVTRISGFIEESRACDVRHSTIYPRKAKDTSGSFRFILNTEDYVQTLEIERCLGEGEVCKVDNDAPSQGSTVCRQKYARYELLAIDKDGNDVIDFFRLPSACICHHKRGKANFESFDVFGLRIANAPLPICKAKEPESESIDLTRTTASSTTTTTTPTTTESYYDSDSYYSTEGPEFFFPISTPQEDNSRIRFEDDQDEAAFEPAVKRIGGYRSKRQARKSQSAIRKRLQPRGCGSGKRYCENYRGYPSQLVNQIVTSESKIPYKIKNKLIKQACIDEKDFISTRQFNIDEQELCQGSRRIIAPTEAININNEWRLIMNTQNYTQTVEIEECFGLKSSDDFSADVEITQDFGSCMYSGIQGNNPDQTVCKQLYREHKLLAVTEGEELEIDSFSLPSACACFLRDEFSNLEFLR